MVKNIYQYIRSLNTSLQTILFVCTVTFLFLIIVFQGLSIIQLRYDINGLKDNIFEAENENKVLLKRIEETSTERYAEEIARNKLGMVRTGESPVKVTEIVEETTTENTNTIDSKDKAGIYLKEWYDQLSNWFEGSKKKG